MAGIVSDPFITLQVTPVVLPPPGTWLPLASRGLAVSIGFIENTINTLFPGEWEFANFGGIAAVGDAILSYAYTALVDFSTMATIMLMAVVTPPTGIFMFTMTLTDSLAASQTLPGIPDGFGNIIWPMAPFGLVDKTKIIGMAITVVITNTDPGGAAAVGHAASLDSTAVCLAKDSMITMADGSNKEIQKIKRGDLIMDNKGAFNKVARILHTVHSDTSKIDIVKINKNALGTDLPNKDLYITGWHPILYRGARRPARCLKNLNGIKWWYFNIKAGEILPKDDGQDDKNEDVKTYSLYNIQFDHDGLFIANGLTVQAVSPYSKLFPLKKELYFNLEQYKDILVPESYITDTPWVNDDLNENDENDLKDV